MASSNSNTATVSKGGPAPEWVLRPVVVRGGQQGMAPAPEWVLGALARQAAVVVVVGTVRAAVVAEQCGRVGL